uniref:Pentacotripeptide-repeat region of PRORP domain-containing protein n=1 Tax=Aegilops tauschii subsp. strangulata TaxID=200361 RepID=A0A453M9B7_AEGTS
HVNYALTFLPLMEADAVAPDLVLFSNLIHLARPLRRRRAQGARTLLQPPRRGDQARPQGLQRRHRRLLQVRPAPRRQAPAAPRRPRRRRGTRRRVLRPGPRRARATWPATRGGLALLAHARRGALKPDLSIFNIVLNAYGQLDLARDADRLFWSMRRAGVPPSVGTYNTMLRVYGDAGLFGEAVHLFGLMCSTAFAIRRRQQRRRQPQRDDVQYNTMIAIHGKALEDDKARSLVRQIQASGIKPNAVTYSTVPFIWLKAGKSSTAPRSSSRSCGSPARRWTRCCTRRWWSRTSAPGLSHSPSDRCASSETRTRPSPRTRP